MTYYIGHLRVATSPAALPVTVADVKTQARITHSQHDDLFETLIEATRIYIERVCRLTLITTEYELTFERFPEYPTRGQAYPDGAMHGVVELRRGPVQSVDSIRYIDTDGVEQTLSSDDYYTNVHADPPYAQTVGYWPSVHTDQPGAVTVAYTAGYGDNATDVPALARQVITAIVLDLYEQPQSQMDLPSGITQNQTVQRLIWALRTNL